jgi:hypothetical protein
MVKIRWSSRWQEYRVEAPTGAMYHTNDLDDAEKTAAHMSKECKTTVHPRIHRATNAQNGDW